MIKLNLHQKCLHQLYYYIFKCECLAALTCDEVVVENYFQIHHTNQKSPLNEINVSDKMSLELTIKPNKSVLF